MDPGHEGDPLDPIDFAFVRYHYFGHLVKRGGGLEYTDDLKVEVSIQR